MLVLEKFCNRFEADSFALPLGKENIPIVSMDSHKDKGSGVRIEREKKTVGFMVRKYCALYHGPELCKECESLLRYTAERLDSCPFGDKKPFCSACSVHCYEAEKCERIREVMRKIGPRMLYLMPLEYLRHFWGSIKNRGEE